MRLGTRTRGCAPLALAAALALAAPAWAQDAYTAEDFQKTGIYLSGMAMYAIPMEKGDIKDDTNDLWDATFGPGTSTDVDNSLGLSVQAGYRLHERFAAEVQFDWLTNIEIDSDLAGGGEADSEITMYGLTGNVKTFLLTGRFQPFFALGAGWGQSRFNPAGSGTSERDDGFLMRFGGGIDIYGTPEVAFTLQSHYVLAAGSLEDLDYLSLGAGLMLRFYGDQ